MQEIVYAWAKNADPMVMPEGVSFEMDRTRRKFFVLQVHYVNELPDKDYTGLKISYTEKEYVLFTEVQISERNVNLGVCLPFNHLLRIYLSLSS